MKASEVIKRYEATVLRNYPWREMSVAYRSGRCKKDIHKVMVALDIREQTVAEAIAHGGGLDHRQACAHFSSY